MYGLLLQNMVEYIVKVYGEEKWTEIKDHLKIKVRSVRPCLLKIV